MGLKDIETAVEAYKKLTKEERVLFTIEAGRRRGRKPGKAKKGTRKVKARHVAEEPAPKKEPLDKKFPKEKARKVVDPAAQVTQE